MDTSNDSETQAYVAGLLSNVSHGTLATDATGQYTALAPYVMWPFATTLKLVTGAYLIRGLVLALLVLSTAMCAAAYAWWRTLGVTRSSCLVGLVLLSTSAAFALQIRGWELDKLLEPLLFLLAALAASHRRYALFVVLALLAAANAETGIFAPFILLVAPSSPRRWWILAATLALCALAAFVLLQVAPPVHIPLWIDTSPHQLVNIAGGLCLLPVLGLASGRSAQTGLRWLLYAVVPVWVVFVLATHRLDQGAAFLAPLAMVWLPVTLLEMQSLLRPVLATARVPAARAG